MFTSSERTTVSSFKTPPAYQTCTREVSAAPAARSNALVGSANEGYGLSMTGNTVADGKTSFAFIVFRKSDAGPLGLCARSVLNLEHRVQGRAG